jgi:hypothetical protein
MNVSETNKQTNQMKQTTNNLLFFQINQSITKVNESEKGKKRDSLIVIYENDSQTDMLGSNFPSARCVQRFDDSRVVQFTWLFALCCVLHRYKSQDIRCHQLIFNSFIHSFKKVKKQS